MRAPLPLTKSVESRNGSVFLCDVRGAQACVWQVFFAIVRIRIANLEPCSTLLTFLWAVMTLTFLTSILTLGFSSYPLISALNSRTAVEIPKQVTQSSETFQIADPNANPNLGTVKQFAYLLALANFGIFACLGDATNIWALFLNLDIGPNDS